MCLFSIKGCTYYVETLIKVKNNLFTLLKVAYSAKVLNCSYQACKWKQQMYLNWCKIGLLCKIISKKVKHQFWKLAYIKEYNKYNNSTYCSFVTCFTCFQNFSRPSVYNKLITSLTSMFNEATFREILPPASHTYLK